ncbi:MAG: ABC transporter substrate-binding protein [Rhodoferax sp.]|nr:ABC transporter substrate-binding protein [Rhodoferax sp.]
MQRRPFLTSLAPLAMWLAAGLPSAVRAQKTVVRVGMSLPRPPYLLDSGVEGLEYEVAEAALSAGGSSMVALVLPPARGLAMQRAGQLDVLLSVDEGIGGTDFFSEPYLTYQNVATTLTSRGLRIKSIEDLLNYSVAGFQNANVILGERFKAVVERHSNYTEYSRQITQNNLLFSAHVDVVVGDRRIFRYFTTQIDPKVYAQQDVTFHPIFPPNPRKAVFKDAAVRDGFNAGLKTIRANGVLDAIVKKYAAYSAP